MTKQIKEYLAYLAEFMSAEHTAAEYKKQLESLYTRIGFYSHERLVHLLVTLFFGVFFLLSFFLAVINGGIGIYLLAGLFLILLVPYIKHYYFLENSVQKLYLIYYDIEKLCGEEKNVP